jgi:MFS family permease
MPPDSFLKRTVPLPVVFRALRHRNYRLFISGQLVSLVGTWMQTVAQSWLVYRLTGSAVLLGTVGFASQIPVFLLSPIGGAVADRRNRHHVVIATQTASMLLAFILAALTLTARVQIWHILFLATLLGIVNAFDIPARQAFIPELVSRQDLLNAIALNSSMFNGARVLGPAVAGILVAAVGEGWCFFANGVSFLAVIVGLFLMRVEPHVYATHEGSALEQMAEGFRWVGRTAPIRALLLLLGLVSIMGMPYTILMPIMADRVLHSGASGMGLLMGATGIGALIGALMLAARRSVAGLGRWVAAASAGFGASVILFSFSRSFTLSLALLLPVGFSMIVQMASSNTLIQAMVPDRLRGRVMAVYSMMFTGMAPIGSLLAGVVSGRVGAPATIAFGGAVCLLGALIFARELPSLRGEAARLIVTQQALAGEPPQEATGTGTTPETGTRAA